MSDTLVAYVISVVILAVLALSVPCIELLARLLRTPLRDEGESLSQSSLKSRGNSHKVA
ncbi:hypothetical protein HDF16_003226 [Granulicella aggregans]|uniref:Uncharacterized protein n=1 Tax=Granulicella aggregans TaxID=474949 RepID=A0A7W7ZEW6_9BACT|nr:hypothetical protein [Granulicella aggregans]MBB5058512.1 hypothetical protein [Granulicella aggregans]